MNKHDRMLHILNLLRTRKNLNAQKLAEECAVTERTIYRDILSLSEMNVPVYYDNGYKMATDNFLPPLNFSYDEYQLLKNALESSPLLDTDKYRDIYKSLTAKIDNCLSDTVRNEFRFAPKATHIEIESSDEDLGAEYYALIESAITESKQIKINYTSISSGDSQRIIDPYFIIFRGRAFYFVGYCHSRKEIRTFRLNRINDISLLDRPYIRDTTITPESYFKDSWSVFSGQPVTVKVLFTGTAAKIIGSSKHHPQEKIENGAEDSLIYTVTVNGLDEIKRWVVGFGAEAEVLEPTELQYELRELGGFYCEKYPDKSS